MSSAVLLRVFAVQGILEYVDVILKYNHLVEKIIYTKIVHYINCTKQGGSRSNIPYADKLNTSEINPLHTNYAYVRSYYSTNCHYAHIW